MLLGFGIFNLVEGVIDHQILGIHHVNETVPPDQWIYWDLGFLVWGALMLTGGWLLLQAGKRDTAARSVSVNYILHQLMIFSFLHDPSLITIPVILRC